jgi:hypothetical protein
MAQLILFGGGDAGGLFIGPKGVRPIPPLDLNIRLQLRGLSALLKGSEPMQKKSSQEMATLMNKLSNLIFTQVEGIIGPLEGDHSLIYQDDEGGFYCGSTGKPPLPFPWPPRIYPNLNDLMSAGVLEKELIDFVSKVVEQKMDILNVLENPAAVALKLGIQLSKRAINDLQLLAPSQLKKVSDPINREIIQFFHAVAKDGQFLSTWATHPYQVADQLKVKLSDAACEKILNYGASTFSDPTCIFIVIGIVLKVVIGVIIVIGVVTEIEGEPEVIDRSGKSKF